MPFWSPNYHKEESYGKVGMNLWQIFVLAQYPVKNEFNVWRIVLHGQWRQDLRFLLGIEGNVFGVPHQEINFQNLTDNLNLIRDEMMVKITAIIVSLANAKVLKKSDSWLYLKKQIFMRWIALCTSLLITTYCGFNSQDYRYGKENIGVLP